MQGLLFKFLIVSFQIGSITVEQARPNVSEGVHDLSAISTNSNYTYNSQIPLPSGSEHQRFRNGTSTLGDEDDFDFIFDFHKSPRWAWKWKRGEPEFAKKWCIKKCKKVGKPFGQLIGPRCRCLCPLNAADLNLCDTSGHCDKFCASIKFPKGGNCVFNNVCFCYCRKHEKYDIFRVYTADEE